MRGYDIGRHTSWLCNADRKEAVALENSREARLFHPCKLLQKQPKRCVSSMTPL